MNCICLVVHSLEVGGLERVMSLLANNFAERENTEVHLVLVGIKRRISYPLRDSVIVHRPGFTFKNSRRTFDTLRTMRFIRSEIKRIDPDTVLSFGEMWNNMVLLSLYGLEYPIYISDRSQPDKNLGRVHNFLREKLYPKAAGFIAQTKKSREICLKNGWNRNVKIIGNPIRKVKLDPSIEKENIVLTVGRLIKTKNIDQLIEIFSEINPPDWKLVIVGGDAKKLTLHDELQQKVDELKMGDCVFLEGQQKDVDSYYCRSKLFAFTSSSEGFPNVIGEALSAGLPVVAYDCVAGPADMIENGENGYLVPVFDQQKFSERLISLMNNEELRIEMSRNAAKSMSRNDPEKVSDKFYSFIMQES